MKSIGQDLKFGIQLLTRNPAFTVVALLTLALCIGANSAIFTVVDSVLLRPLPYPDSDRLVMLYNIYPNVGVNKGSNGVPDYLDRRQETEVFESLALMSFTSRAIGPEGRPRRVVAVTVTPTIFDVLKTQPVLGRGFTEDEAKEGHDKVAILSEELWREEFGGDPSALGSDIRIEGTPHRIVGILPAGFRLLSQETPLLLPFAFTQQQMSDDARHSNFCDMIGRLKPDVDIAQAQSKINLLNERNAERFPETRAILQSAGFATKVVDLHGELVEEIQPVLYLLLAGVAFVLLIGCLNIANLLLVRSSGRHKELAIRFALGAGRVRVARQLLTESVLLSILGGALGILVGWGSLRGLVALFSDRLPRVNQIQLDSSAILFTMGVALLAGLAFGAVPVFHVLRNGLESLLRESGRTGTAGVSTSLTRSALVVAQVSIACMLLVGAGLMTVSFSKLAAVDPGFKSENLYSSRVNLPQGRYPGQTELNGFVQRALTEIRALPGVESASLTSLLPFSGNNNASAISIENHPLQPGESPPVPHFSVVGPDYFKAMGIPLLKGRFLDERDTADTVASVVVDESLAERCWPNEDPIGRRLMNGIDGDSARNDSTWRTVVGVVGKVRVADLATQDKVGTVYFPQTQNDSRNFALVVKAAGSQEGLADMVRESIAKVDPELPVYDSQTMGTRLAESLLDRRAPMMILLAFAGLSLLLSAIGVYGVLAYSVTQRTREIGIRLALGAQTRSILAQVLRQGAALVAIGLGLGLAGSLALSRIMSNFLFEVAATDPWVLAGVSLSLSLVALTACLIPSIRATRVDAVIALRNE